MSILVFQYIKPCHTKMAIIKSTTIYGMDSIKNNDKITNLEQHIWDKHVINAKNMQKPIPIAALNENVM